MLDRRHPFFRHSNALWTSARFAKEVGLVRHLSDDAAYRAGGYHPDMTLGSSKCDYLMSITFQAWIARQVGCYPSRYWSTCLTLINPFEKMCRILRPVYERHSDWQTDSSHAGYGDFWRFTHEGLALMFAEAGFSRVEVYPIDGWLISRLEVLGLYRYLTRLPVLRTLIHKFDRPRLGRSATMHFVRAEK